jgi:hypothetical protein
MGNAKMLDAVFRNIGEVARHLNLNSSEKDIVISLIVGQA